MKMVGSSTCRNHVNVLCVPGCSDIVPESLGIMDGVTAVLRAEDTMDEVVRRRVRHRPKSPRMAHTRR